MIERQLARYLTDLADALHQVTSGQVSYGEFYVSEVRIGFDGEDAGFKIVPNDFGDYSIVENPTQ